MKSKVIKFRPALDMTEHDRAMGDYAEREEHLRRVHAVRKNIKTRTKFANHFQRRLLSQLERIGMANGFNPPPTHSASAAKLQARGR